MEMKPVDQWPGTPDPSLSIPTPCEQHRSDLEIRSFFGWIAALSGNIHRKKMSRNKMRLGKIAC